MSQWDYTLLCAVIGAGTSGGVFVAFSTFVMAALRRLDPAGGIRAMQHINRTVITPGFMVPWLGTGALSLALGWNHLRALACLVAAVSFVLVLR